MAKTIDTSILEIRTDSSAALKGFQELEARGATLGQKMQAVGTQMANSFTGLGTAAKAAGASLESSFTRSVATVTKLSGALTALSAGVALVGSRGADVADVRHSFEDLTAAIGESGDVMLGRLRKATLGTISDFDLMATANKSLSEGLSLTADQLALVGDTAAVMADRTGGDAKTAFDTLMQAMATGKDKQLKTIGLSIDAAQATEDYARALGKAAKDLTDLEKKEAVKNAILQEGQRVLALSGKAQEDFADRVKQTSTGIQNLVDSIGQWVATTPALGTFASALTAVSASITAIGIAWGPVGTALSGISFSAIGAAATAAAPAILAIATAVAAVWAAWKIGNIESVKSSIAEWALSADNLTAKLYRWSVGLDQLTPAEAKAAVAATAAAERMSASGQAHLDAAAAVKAHVHAINEFVGPVMDAATEQQLYAAQLVKQEAAQKRAADATTKAAEKITQWKTSVTEATEAMGLSVFALHRYGAVELPNATARMTQAIEDARSWVPPLASAADGVDELASGVADLQRESRYASAALIELGQRVMTLPAGLDPAATAMAQFRKKQDDAAKAALSFGASLRVGLLENLKNVPQMIAASFTGGGGLKGAAQAIGSTFGATFGKSLFGEAGVSGLAKKLSGTLGALVSGLGPVIGALAGPIISMIAKIGGPSKEEVAARDRQSQLVDQLRQMATEAEKTEGAFQDTYHTIAIVGRDAFLAMGESAAEADAHVRDLLNTHDPAAFARGLAAVNQALALQKDASDLIDTLASKWQNAGAVIPASMRETIASLLKTNALTDAQRQKLGALLERVKPDFESIKAEAEGFGVSLAGLGPKFEQGDLEARAKKLTDFIARASDAGADMGGVLAGTADEFSALVQEAAKFGTAIPDNMRPYVENLIAAGKLLDENGKAIDDVGQINFEATPLNQGLEDLNDTLKKLMELFERMSGLRINTTFNTDYTTSGTPPNTTQPAAPPWNPTGTEGEGGFATGTPDFDFLDFGIRQPTFLHGEEAVIPRGGGHQLAAEIAAALGSSAASQPTISNFNTTKIENNINALDPRSFHELLDREGIPYIVGEIDSNRRGLQRRLRQAMGIA